MDINPTLFSTVMGLSIVIIWVGRVYFVRTKYWRRRSKRRKKKYLERFEGLDDPILIENPVWVKQMLKIHKAYWDVAGPARTTMETLQWAAQVSWRNHECDGVAFGKRIRAASYDYYNIILPAQEIYDGLIQSIRVPRYLDSKLTPDIW